MKQNIKNKSKKKYNNKKESKINKSLKKNSYFNKVKMQYWKPSEAIASSVDKGELYAVGSETVYSSQ